MFDVRYVITWEHDLPGPYASDRIAIQGDEWAKDTVYVHRLSEDFARVWIVHWARPAADLVALEMMAGAAFDPTSEVIVSDPGMWLDADPNETSSDAQIIAYAPEEITVEADLKMPGWLVLGEWYYPGWQVWIDDVRSEIIRVDYGLRGVPLPLGVHKVVFRYRPLSVLLGGGITLLTVVLIVAITVYVRRDRTNHAAVDRVELGTEGRD
jgi:hypothetical protein